MNIFDTQKALSNFNAISDFAKNSNSDLSKNLHTLSSLNIDLESMAKNKPYLYGLFIKVLSREMNSQNISFIKNMLIAYDELQDSGKLKIVDTKSEVLQNHLNQFIEKVDGPTLLSINEFDEFITTQINENKTTIQIDFYNFIAILEEYYDFNHRNFFNHSFDYKNRNDAIMACLDIKQREFQKELKLGPDNSLKAAKIKIYGDFFEHFNNVPYVNFWHDLLDKDFLDISNGSVASMSKEYLQKQSKSEIHNLENTVFSTIRKLIFKEIAQHPQYNGTVPQELEFHISW